MRLLDGIRAYCKAEGITLKELCAEIGINEKTIFRWNEKVPSVDKVARVAVALGITVEDLINAS